MSVFENLCPKCSRYGKWDGNKCDRCLYDVEIAKADPFLMAGIFKLLNPSFYPLEMLYKKKELIPDQPGLYAWYFKGSGILNTLFSEHTALFNSLYTVESYQKNDVWSLMYIGIASGQSLRSRIYSRHLIKGYDDSTLRHTLCSILFKEIDLDCKEQLKTEKEQDKLNKWMFENARVTWIATENPKLMESTIIKNYGHYLPFNIAENESNPIMKPVISKLKLIRDEWKRFGK